MSHPSPFELECLVVGDAPPWVEEHVRDCVACRRTVSHLEQEQAEFRARHDGERLFATLEVRAPKDRRSSMLARPAIAALSLAVAASVAFGVVGLNEERGRDGGRFKGLTALRVLRERAGTVVEGCRDVAVRPGDRLRFVVTVGAAGSYVLATNDESLGTFQLESGEHVLPEHGLAVEPELGETRIRLAPVGPPGETGEETWCSLSPSPR